jgi:Zn-dependent protease
MNNPMNWSLPLFRAFGVQVRVHILYIVITLSLFLRTAYGKDTFVSVSDVFLFTVPLVFLSILFHEFGHIFGGRAVGGEGEEILMWPLGGLAFVEVPREWKAHTLMILAGPAVNLGIAVLAAGVLAGSGFLPTLNPFESPYVAPMKNYRDGRVYTSEYGLKLYEPGSSTPIAGTERGNYGDKPELQTERAADHTARNGLERAVAPTWVVWVNRIFWMNWVLLLFNMLVPAFPMDAAQTVQGLVWWRTDYRTGLRIACYCGYGTGLVMLIVGFALNESLVVGLSLFCLFESWRRLFAMNNEGGEFGYDFSGGYSSLEGDDPPTKRPKKLGFIKRWMQARTAKRLQKEHDQRLKDDTRVDELLDKINSKQQLTDEEQRFMKRVSERYKKQ